MATATHPSLPPALSKRKHFAGYCARHRRFFLAVRAAVLRFVDFVFIISFSTCTQCIFATFDCPRHSSVPTTTLWVVAMVSSCAAAHFALLGARAGRRPHVCGVIQSTKTPMLSLFLRLSVFLPALFTARAFTLSFVMHPSRGFGTKRSV